MKRFFILLVLSVMAFTAVSAQDMESLTALFNEGAVALNDGNKALALEKFEAALGQADIIGPDADEISATCKTTIPTILLSIGKEYAAAKDLDQAVPALNKAIEKAKEYEQQDVVTEASELIPQLYMAEGNSKLNAKDFPGAIAMYKKALELDPNDGVANLRLGIAASRVNDEAAAVDAFQKAAANGQEKAATKELGKYYLKLAVASLKAKNNAKAQEYGQKAIAAYDGPETVQALSICGKVAMAKNDYAGAIENYEAYLAKNAKAKDANATMYYLATAYEKTGNKEKACGYYKQIVADPTFAETAKYKISTELKCN